VNQATSSAVSETGVTTTLSGGAVVYLVGLTTPKLSFANLADTFVSSLTSPW
jgi:hypothetical protein